MWTHYLVDNGTILSTLGIRFAMNSTRPHHSTMSLLLYILPALGDMVVLAIYNFCVHVCVCGADPEATWAQ